MLPIDGHKYDTSGAMMSLENTAAEMLQMKETGQDYLLGSIEERIDRLERMIALYIMREFG